MVGGPHFLTFPSLSASFDGYFRQINVRNPGKSPMVVDIPAQDCYFPLNDDILLFPALFGRMGHPKAQNGSNLTVISH